MTLDHLNALGDSAFVATLAGIFEHSPWVAEGVLRLRPFDTVEALHEAMCAVVADAGPAAQLALIRAHPQLAGKAAIAGELTVASGLEQSGAGLLHCSPAEYAQLTELNAAYQQRFGFPFILAVRGHDRARPCARSVGSPHFACAICSADSCPASGRGKRSHLVGSDAHKTAVAAAP